MEVRYAWQSGPHSWRHHVGPRVMFETLTFALFNFMGRKSDGPEERVGGTCAPPADDTIRETKIYCIPARTKSLNGQSECPRYSSNAR